MGLFNLLKNGLTIEKKKTAAVETSETTTAEEITEEPITEEPATPVIPETPLNKRLEAECILYGDTNVPQQPAPTPAPTTPPTEQPAATNTPHQQTFNAYSNTANFNNVLLGQATANQNLLVIAPKSPDEISAILSNLASGNACIVSLAKIPDAQRHLDYICGFMNAIGGTIMQRTATEYILTPKGVGIRS